MGEGTYALVGIGAGGRYLSSWGFSPVPPGAAAGAELRISGATEIPRRQAAGITGPDEMDTRVVHGALTEDRRESLAVGYSVVALVLDVSKALIDVAGRGVSIPLGSDLCLLGPNVIRHVTLSSGNYVRWGSRIGLPDPPSVQNGRAARHIPAIAKSTNCCNATSSTPHAIASLKGTLSLQAYTPIARSDQQAMSSTRRRSLPPS